MGSESKRTASKSDRALRIKPKKTEKAASAALAVEARKRQVEASYSKSAAIIPEASSTATGPEPLRRASKRKAADLTALATKKPRFNEKATSTSTKGAKASAKGKVIKAPAVKKIAVKVSIGNGKRRAKETTRKTPPILRQRPVASSRDRNHTSTNSGHRSHYQRQQKPRGFSWGFKAHYRCGQGNTVDITHSTRIDNTAIGTRDLRLVGAGVRIFVMTLVAEF